MDPRGSHRGVSRSIHGTAASAHSTGATVTRQRLPPARHYPPRSCSTSAGSAAIPRRSRPRSNSGAPERPTPSTRSWPWTWSSGGSSPGATRSGAASRTCRGRSGAYGDRARRTRRRGSWPRAARSAKRRRRWPRRPACWPTRSGRRSLRYPTSRARTPRMARENRTTSCCARRATTPAPTVSTSGCPTGRSAPSSASSTMSGPPRSRARCSPCTGAGAPGCCGPWCSSASTATPTHTRRSARRRWCARRR